MIEKDIIRDAAQMYGCTEEDVKSRKRHRQYAEARAVVCYMLYSFIGRSCTETATLLNRTHGTVLYFNNRACDWLNMPRLNPRGAEVIKVLVERYKNKEQ